MKLIVLSAFCVIAFTTFSEVAGFDSAEKEDVSEIQNGTYSSGELKDIDYDLDTTRGPVDPSNPPTAPTPAGPDGPGKTLPLLHRLLKFERDHRYFNFSLLEKRTDERRYERDQQMTTFLKTVQFISTMCFFYVLFRIAFWL
ncbi:uncharacterized protein LOC124358030 isoform X3 [Homalodisca vitripennis]|uniref:uncharacterized protein LOC124358030 isoform X3 n=1 Tax=Homalodisca vitripennis TaxID=197043 RepID=UPI001EEA7397|nr:uncharacterized protein LOC124358030 isoform X3 [Homalodisca vitripennis]